jgi:trimeric autotransporter adhesin
MITKVYKFAKKTHSSALKAIGILLFSFGLSNTLNAQINIENLNIDVSTYLGGTGTENSTVIQVIGNEVHILGQTSSNNYPVTNGSTRVGTGNKIVYTKLNASTGAIITSTYLGGGADESPTAMQVIGNEVHIFGLTYSNNYPVTNGSTYGGNGDIVYTKLNASTGAIITSTYLGGSLDEYPIAMQVIESEVHILVLSQSPNYPVTSGSMNGTNDMVYTKLNASTGAIIISNFIGGGADDYPTAMQVIGNEVHILGET